MTIQNSEQNSQPNAVPNSVPNSVPNVRPHSKDRTPSIAPDLFRFIRRGSSDSPDFLGDSQVATGRNLPAARGDGLLKRLLRNTSFVVGLALTILVVVPAIFVPLINGAPSLQDIDVQSKYLSPSMDNLFGTDSLGRDQWSLIWYGTRISLFIGFVSFVVDIVVGMTYGVIAGYFGGKVDAVMQRIIEVASGIPQLIVVSLFVLTMGPGVTPIILGLVFNNWIPMSRVARAEVLLRRSEEYVLAARTVGRNRPQILFQELLPNILSQVITMAMFSIPIAIFTESYFSFVGLGIQPPGVSLGSLINVGYGSFLTYPYLVLIPVCVLVVLMVGVNLLSDGLRNVVDPSIKSMESR